MINKIDIGKFGLFSNYNWELEVGSNPDKDSFKKVNIIYGRNYSGKTTLSRIFRCVEKKELHKDYSDTKFTMYTKEGVIVSESNLEYNKSIRVYNSDFVREKLSWLHDNDGGKIEPFTLVNIGDPEIERNILKLEKDIEDIDIKLGTLSEGSDSIEEDTLYFKKDLKEREATNAKNNVSNLEKDLMNRIQGKANQDIKKNPYYLDQKDSSRYNISNLDKEIKDIRENNIDCSLSEEHEELQKKIIKEDEKNSISLLPPLNFNFTSYLTSVRHLLTKEIKISKRISESIERDLLDWLKLGCKLHKETDICEFCQNPISTQRRNELEAFFNKESEELEQALNHEIKKLDLLKTQLNDYPLSSKLSRDIFYAALHSEFDRIKTKWTEAEVSQIKQIDLLRNGLLNRLNQLHTPIEDFGLASIATNTIDFDPIINELNNLIIENNEKTITVEQEKDEARKVLRYNLIKNFLESIDYDALLEAIEKAKQEEGKIKSDYEQINEIISQTIEKKENIQKDINKLKTKLNDQSVAAEKIDEHLRNFFGHDSIQLRPSEQQIDDQVVTRFVVKRGNEDAKNLSEGECSLVAFCYFMARIEDEIQNADAKDKLIIYIDDPISSLDNNHVFFVFGLIESVITKGKNFNQLFISTHNLEFLRYLKRLTIPKDIIIDEEGKEKSQTSLSNYLIYKNKNGSISQSYIRYMPKYLSSYTTEYNFLFSQIYEMATPKNNKVCLYENQFSLLYNLPNNMRKFLECFLFYKYPDTNSPLHFYLSKLFDGAVHPKVNRIINEYSHLTWGERGTIPTDVAEAEEIAQLILKSIKHKDPEHYEALCKSIKVDPNII